MTVDVVVVLPGDTYADAVRRGFYSTADQTILSLLDSPRVRRVLVADQPRGLLSQVSRRLRGDRPAPRSDGLRGVRPLVVRTPLPLGLAQLRRRYRAYDAAVAAAARVHGLKSPAVISFNAHYSAHARARWASSHVYYAQDDALEISRLAPWREPLRWAYDALSSLPVTVVAVSRELAGRIGDPDRAVVIPNGVDPDLWLDLPERTSSPRERPLACYFGTVDTRLDEAAFAQLGTEFEVVVTGPLADRTVVNRIGALPGVSVRGPVKRQSVVSQLRCADVAVLAHNSTRLTEAMSPLKYFEYVSSGTPVIASALAGVREVAAADEMVPVGGDYLGAARSALRRGPLAEPVRKDAVRAMSWRTRHQVLLDLVDGGG